MEVAVSRLKLNGASDELSCDGMCSVLRGKHAEKMQCFGVGRPIVEDLAIKEISFRQPPGAVVPQCLRQHLIHCCHGRYLSRLDLCSNRARSENTIAAAMLAAYFTEKAVDFGGWQTWIADRPYELLGVQLHWRHRECAADSPLKYHSPADCRAALMKSQLLRRCRRRSLSLSSPRGRRTTRLRFPISRQR